MDLLKYNIVLHSIYRFPDILLDSLKYLKLATRNFYSGRYIYTRIKIRFFQ